jgi:hypothetical protein
MTRLASTAYPHIIIGFRLSQSQFVLYIYICYVIQYTLRLTCIYVGDGRHGVPLSAKLSLQVQFTKLDI